MQPQIRCRTDIANDQIGGVPWMSGRFIAAVSGQQDTADEEEP